MRWINIGCHARFNRNALAVLDRRVIESIRSRLNRYTTRDDPLVSPRGRAALMDPGRRRRRRPRYLLGAICRIRRACERFITQLTGPRAVRTPDGIRVVRAWQIE